MNEVQALKDYEPQFREILGKALDKTEFASVTAPATPDTEFPVEHGRGFVPIGFLAISKDRAADVYLSTTAATNEQIFLKCSVGSAVLRILVF